MRVTDGSYIHLYSFEPTFAVATIQASLAHQSHVQQGFTARPMQGVANRFVVGARVASLWSDNFYYMATIQQALGTGQYKILYDDGTPSTVHEHQLIPVIHPSSAYVGQPVLAVWQKAGRLYEAKISNVKHASAIVIWDDGGSLSEVAWSDIVPRI